MIEMIGYNQSASSSFSIASKICLVNRQNCHEKVNLHHLLWTYLINDDKTKKARYVCDGSPHMTGSVTLAESYAGSLDQVASKVLWAAAAIIFLK